MAVCGMKKPLAVELFAGLHGWGEGALAAGFRVVGFDIVDMCAFLGKPRPAGIDLVLQDVKTMHGSQLKDAEIIFASPPCQEFSKYAMPFGALWEEHDRMDDDGAPPGNYLHKPCPNTYLFHWCFVLQREASEAAGRQIPMVIENVRGAARFVGKSVWNYGSFHLYGDVPALMPINLKRGRKVDGMKRNPDGTEHPQGSWFRIADSSQGDRGGIKQLHSRGDNATAGRNRMGLGAETLSDGQKFPSYSDPRRNGGKGVHLTSPQENADAQLERIADLAKVAPEAAMQVLSGTKIGGDWFSDPNGQRDQGIENADLARENQSPKKKASERSEKRKSEIMAEIRADGSKGFAGGLGRGHGRDPGRQFNSRSNARKMASAMIAKIPLELARHIAAVFKPRQTEAA